jgi:hypothetical protein
MPILNYTTAVPADRTVSRIHERLRRTGATAIVAKYEKGRITALSFTLVTAVGERAFIVPLAVDRVLAVLRSQSPKVAPRYCTLEHAEKVALRITEDWLKSMLAIIETELVTFDQVMLPYMRALDGSTVYQKYLEHGVMMLEGGTGNADQRRRHPGGV